MPSTIMSTPRISAGRSASGTSVEQAGDSQAAGEGRPEDQHQQADHAEEAQRPLGELEQDVERQDVEQDSQPDEGPRCTAKHAGPGRTLTSWSEIRAAGRATARNGAAGRTRRSRRAPRAGRRAPGRPDRSTMAEQGPQEPWNTRAWSRWPGELLRPAAADRHVAVVKGRDDPRDVGGVDLQMRRQGEDGLAPGLLQAAGKRRRLAGPLAKTTI